MEPATGIPICTARRRNIAGYVRVSADSAEQLTSYEVHIDYYRQLRVAIWKRVHGQAYLCHQRKEARGFNRMIQDAPDGGIDLIVIKSVSRFVRNTIDSLTTVRKLKKRGGRYFQEGNIDTLEFKGELLIPIISSLAKKRAAPAKSMDQKDYILTTKLFFGHRGNPMTG